MISTLFFATGYSLTVALSIFVIIVLAVLTTLVVSKLLSMTILKGEPSHFMMELPPYRRPKVLQVIARSVVDKTLTVLGRAVAVAAPAGILIWLLQNITIDQIPLLGHISAFLNPLAQLMGLDGVILAAFIIGIPANEIVIPIILMCYLGSGSLHEVSSLQELGQLLIQNGWTLKTAVCTILFSLNHFPCATTLLTIKKETNSFLWSSLAFLIPTAAGMLLCFITAFLFGIFGY